HDPGTIINAPLSRLAANALHMDEIIRDVAQEQVEQGAELATKAGFKAEGRLEQGKPWHEICRVADELDAEAIVVGARGLGRVESALRGSVSWAVVHHARRPVLVVPHHDGTSSLTRAQLRRRPSDACRGAGRYSGSAQAALTRASSAATGPKRDPAVFGSS